MHIAVIEMPKGDTVRRHLSTTGNGFIELGLIKDRIPINNGVMPAHYGYIKNTRNRTEGDEVDTIIISDKKYEVAQELEIFPIALIKRADSDDKIVAIDDAFGSVQQWNDIPESEQKLLLEFFGHHHAILSIEDAIVAEIYLKETAI